MTASAHTAEHLLAELVAGRWPGTEVPRLACEQIIALAMVRHLDERDAIAAVLPLAAVRDHLCRSIYRAALRADPSVDSQYEAVAAELAAMGSPRTALDVVLEGGDVVFLAGAYWRQAVAELSRRHEADRLRDQLVAALCALAAGARPEQVAQRLTGAVVE